jgi:hypothetical protein
MYGNATNADRFGRFFGVSHKQTVKTWRVALPAAEGDAKAHRRTKRPIGTGMHAGRLAVPRR